MKKVIILSVLLGFTFASQAQTFEDTELGNSPFGRYGGCRRSFGG